MVGTALARPAREPAPMGPAAPEPPTMTSYDSRTKSAGGSAFQGWRSRHGDSVNRTSNSKTKNMDRLAQGMGFTSEQYLNIGGVLLVVFGGGLTWAASVIQW